MSDLTITDLRLMSKNRNTKGIKGCLKMSY